MVGGIFRARSGEAPPAPRPLDKEIERDCARHGRTARLFGLIWACIGLGIAAIAGALGSAGGFVWGVIGLAGALLWLVGWSHQRRARRVYVDGVEARGHVVGVAQDRRIRVNGKHPWRVEYEFSTDTEGTIKDKLLFWGERPLAEPGQRVIVLYDRERPSRSVLWSRLDVPDAGSRVRIAAEAPAPEPSSIEEAAEAEEEAIAEAERFRR